MLCFTVIFLSLFFVRKGKNYFIFISSHSSANILQMALKKVKEKMLSTFYFQNIEKNKK